MHAFLKKMSRFEEDVNDNLNIALQKSATQSFDQDRAVVDKVQGNADVEDLKFDLLNVYYQLI